VARAAFLVAAVIEREQYLGDELAALVEYRVNHVWRRILEPRQVGIIGQPTT